MSTELHPLGRVIQHDPRSRAYGLEAHPLDMLRALQFHRPYGVPRVTVRHQSHGTILDQGQLSSCTGNATVAALGCDPVYAGLPAGTPLDEAEAVAIYSLATTLDEFPGSYPPQDNGSSGLAAAKAAQQKGLLSGYVHAFGIEDALDALQVGPVITGIDWYEGFDTPNASGVVYMTGEVRGGHEVCADGYDALHDMVWFRNSWGPSWGLGGRFCMATSRWATLLSQQGDATILVPISLPAPTPITPTPAPPTPTPVVNPADGALLAWWADTREFALAKHTGTANKRAANAARNYATSKGLL